MKTYGEMLKALAPAKPFDQRAFSRDAEWPQDLCDLMLALALAFNDFKDVLAAHVLLNSVQPAGKPALTAEWGSHGGMVVHVMRIQCGLVFEMLELLRKKSRVLNSDAFQSIVKRLAPRQKAAWLALEDAAMRRKGARVLTDALEDIRNGVAFHYDSDELRRGFEAFFARPPQEPMLSSGNNLVKSRFYFADAAAQEAMIGRSDKARYFLEGNDVLLRHIHQALFHLVAYFIQLRTGKKAGPARASGRRR